MDFFGRRMEIFGRRMDSLRVCGVVDGFMGLIGWTSPVPTDNK